ncbi:hypothetical protein M885DRAFT_532169 [Pelagophyceae sp. CCMP2097]|nr:hypothetical protein M885DRAFT_532169 [Pelagophyceae sp. CCMP2097]
MTDARRLPLCTPPLSTLASSSWRAASASSAGVASHSGAPPHSISTTDEARAHGGTSPHGGPSQSASPWPAQSAAASRASASRAGTSSRDNAAASRHGAPASRASALSAPRAVGRAASSNVGRAASSKERSLPVAAASLLFSRRCRSEASRLIQEERASGEAGGASGSGVPVKASQCGIHLPEIRLAVDCLLKIHPGWGWPNIGSDNSPGLSSALLLL